MIDWNNVAAHFDLDGCPQELKNELNYLELVATESIQTGERSTGDTWSLAEGLEDIDQRFNDWPNYLPRKCRTAINRALVASGEMIEVDPSVHVQRSNRVLSVRQRTLFRLDGKNYELP